MLNYDKLIEKAKENGFQNAGPLDVGTLEFLPEVRDMCASGRCQVYGKNWACPPACGTLDDMRARVAKYSRGLLVQTVGQLEDNMDWENMQLAAQNHEKNFQKFWEVLERDYPGLLAMGAGTCTKCKQCAYVEGKPCRFPERLMYSMEACGLFVSKVCTDNGMKYNHGPNTVAYTAASCLSRDGGTPMTVRLMTADDYDGVFALWNGTPGVGLNEIDDSREGIEKYLRRNPTSCFVAQEDGRLVGSILSGHDGRRGVIYHMTVDEAYRRRGIGLALVAAVKDALRNEGITKILLVVMKSNASGNSFWEALGFTKRDDLVYRNLSLK